MAEGKSSSNEPVPIPNRKGGSSGHLMHSIPRGGGGGGIAPPLNTLMDRCRAVIVANLERFPPESFGVCDEDEWETIIRVRHTRTAPKKGVGGLDGTGRNHPAVSERFLAAVEEACPHLSESDAVDGLVWRDCVQCRFPAGGLRRPRALQYPWPILEERIRQAGAVLVRRDLSNDSSDVANAIKTLKDSPMNVDLLKSTGIGKAVKKAAKLRGGDTDLEQLLQSWMSLAASSGVKMDQPVAKRQRTGAKLSSKSGGSLEDEEADLELAQTCKSWRQLFAALKQRDEEKRESQGKRMREKRRKLGRDRPQVVKVRPTLAKHDRNGVPGLHSKPRQDASKMVHLRHEAAVQVARRATARTSSPIPPTKAGGGFGAAVAFASASKKPGGASRLRQLGSAGSKRMTVPSRIVKGAGGQPRQMASKWKKHLGRR